MNISRLSLVGTLAVWTLGSLYACSSSDDNTSDTNASDGSTATGDSSATVDDAASSDATIANESGAADSGAVVSFADGGGVRVVDPTGTYDLTQSPASSILGNAQSFGAASFAGGALRSIRFMLRHAVEGGYEIVPGKYTCSLSDPYLATAQYVTPGPVYFQTDGTPASECEVNLTTFGAIGTMTEGTFTAKLPKVGDPDASVQLSGSFQVPRTN